MTAAKLARREFGDSLRNYWFVVNLGLFVAGGLALMLFGARDPQILGHRGYARAVAGLMQLALVVVPLMALFPSAASVAGEREVGTLDFLLAQPVTRAEVFTGKWAGVTLAVSLSVLIGFGVTGTVAGLQGVSAGMLAGLLGFTLLLGAVFASLGLAISAATGTASRATSVGLTVWLALLALGSLGLMGAVVGLGMDPLVLEVWAFVNPVEAFRLAVLTVLDPGVDVLGPVGSALVESLGRGGLVTLATASLVAWCAAGFGLGVRRFTARGP